MSTDNRAIARLLVASRLAEIKSSDVALARAAEVDVKTVRGFLGEKARWPNRETRAKLSEALGWPPNEIDHIEREGQLSPAADDADGVPGLSPDRRPAHHLSDDELLSELTYRMRRYALRGQVGGEGREQGPTIGA